MNVTWTSSQQRRRYCTIIKPEIMLPAQVNLGIDRFNTGRCKSLKLCLRQNVHTKHVVLTPTGEIFYMCLRGISVILTVVLIKSNIKMYFIWQNSKYIHVRVSI